MVLIYCVFHMQMILGKWKKMDLEAYFLPSFLLAHPTGSQASTSLRKGQAC